MDSLLLNDFLISVAFFWKNINYVRFFIKFLKKLQFLMHNSIIAGLYSTIAFAFITVFFNC